MRQDPGDTPDLTPLLERANAGDRAALDEAARLVEADLERLARGLLARRRRKRAGIRIDVSLSALGRKGAAEPPTVNV